MGIMQADQLSSRGMAALRAGRTKTERVAMRRLIWAGPIAVAAAVAATLGAWAVAIVLLPPIDPAFVELRAGSVAIVTAVLCAAAVAVFALLVLLSRRPFRTFTVVAVAALVLSWVPDLQFLSDPTVTIPNVVALMLLHVVAAYAVVWTLGRLTRDA